jgi:hypothetical protein
VAAQDAERARFVVSHRFELVACLPCGLVFSTNQLTLRQHLCYCELAATGFATLVEPILYLETFFHFFHSVFLLRWGPDLCGVAMCVQVEKAEQDKKSAIIRAEGEATSAQLIGDAIKNNPAFITLRRIEVSGTLSLCTTNNLLVDC